MVGIAALMLVSLACREPYEVEGWATRPITDPYTFPARDANGQVIAEGVSVSVAELEKGRHAYMHYCYACHGVNGDGKGPASIGLRPPPRDFRTANFKFGAVRSGELPNDDDLVRIIKGGLHGTAMLEWEISDGELGHVIHFIKTFPALWCDPHKLGDAKTEECKTFTDEQIRDSRGAVKLNRWLDVYTRDSKTTGGKKGQPKPTGEPVTVPEDPWVGKTDKALERGMRVYHLVKGGLNRTGAQCNSCHPSYATKEDLFKASVSVQGECLATCEGKADQEKDDCRKACESEYSLMTSFRDGMYLGIVLEGSKNPYLFNLMPPDFTLHPLRSIRKGQELPDLYRLIASGVGGVMPAWVSSGGDDGLKPEDIWALVHYTKSLMDLRLPENRDKYRELRQKLDDQPPFVVPTGKPAEEAKKVDVSINAEGEVTVDGAPMKQGALADHFSKLVAEGEVAVVINAAKEAPKEKVLKVLDIIKQSGAKVAMTPTEDEEKEDGDTVDDQPDGQPPPESPKGEPKAPEPKAPEQPKPPEQPPPAPAKPPEAPF